MWLSLGGQARLRAEGYRNLNFGAPTKNDDDFYFQQRYHLHADLRLGQALRTFVQTRNAFVSEHDLADSRLSSLEDEFDIQNAFADFAHPLNSTTKMLLRAGRFEQTFGKGRMIGVKEWSQLRSPVQGFKTRVSNSGWSADAFFAYSTKSDLTDWVKRDQDAKQWGLYTRFMPMSPNLTAIEPYFLVKQRVTNGSDTDRLNTGLRLLGSLPFGGIDYDLEGAYQFGNADKKVRAWFAALELVKAFKDIATSPSITLGFDFASGDNDPNDETVRTFEPIEPYSHYYFGYADTMGRQNHISPFLRVESRPIKTVLLNVEGHWFWLDEPADSLYSTCNCSNPVRKGTQGASSYAGFEFDAFIQANVDHHLIVLVGWSHWIAGDFQEDTEGPADDIGRWYTQLQYTF
jgi:hypothetical protein